MYQITIPGTDPINVGYILGQLDANGNLTSAGAQAVYAIATNVPIPASALPSFNTSYSTGTNTIGTNGTSKTVIANQAPNSPVYVTITGANGQSSVEQVGTTDANGNFTFNGAASSAITGAWSETWQVGSKVVGNNSFTVQPATTTTGTSGTVTNTTNNGKTAFSASANGATITAGSGTVAINIANAPANSPVTVTVNGVTTAVTDPTTGLPAMTNSSGSYTGSFTAPASMTAGTYNETWNVGGTTVGSNSFTVQAVASGVTTTATTTKTVTLNLLANGSEPVVGGGDLSVADYLKSNPSAAQGSVAVGYGSDGKTIVSYTINGTTYSPQQLASAIVQVGQQIYNYTAQNGVSNTTVTEGMVSGGQYTGALASLSPTQQAIYFLGTQALALPGTPYVSMPDPNTASAQNQGTILFYPSAGTTMTISSPNSIPASNVFNPSYFSTPAAAAQALVQIQKYYPTATLANATPTSQTIGGATVNVTNPEGTGTGMYQITIPGTDPINVGYILGQLDANGNLSSAGAQTVYAIATNNVSSNWTPLPTNTAAGTTATNSSIASATAIRTAQAASVVNTQALQASQNSVSTQVGGIVKLSTQAQANSAVTVSSSSGNILVNSDATTGVISVVGLAPGNAVVTVHPTNMGSSTAGDQTIQVNVASPTASSGSGNATTLGSSGATTNTTSTATLSTADQATVAQLQTQIQTLQTQITGLNSQLANQTNSGSTVVVSSSDAAQLQSLQGQVQQLSTLVQGLQSGQVSVLGSVDGTANLQSIQAPSGLQMPAGYQTSTAGLQMQADAQPAVQSSQTGSSYTVKKGDTLWSIAKKVYGNGNQWRKILSANPNALSSPGNTKTLKVGFVLTIPAE
jgi:nucleoid-associated protein YgaU